MTSFISSNIRVTILSENLTILSRASVVPTPSAELEPWGTRKYIPGARVAESYVSS
ncbi:predicted protein [Botrytis cinerea T4]|uniref:Uncharacterized protein n=1 Tax=Botryotinia fuckeliana (strain T4) TaxID=999810 RepID=G2YD85_BOTF4|nr:predicted protein [Botrytis cinerea T4]